MTLRWTSIIPVWGYNATWQLQKSKHALQPCQPNTANLIKTNLYTVIHEVWFMAAETFKGKPLYKGKHVGTTARSVTVPLIISFSFWTSRFFPLHEIPDWFYKWKFGKDFILNMVEVRTHLKLYTGSCQARSVTKRPHYFHSTYSPPVTFISNEDWNSFSMSLPAEL